MTTVAVDTSVALADLQDTHPSHQVVRRRLRSQRRVLTGHSLAETYSVLTRLPGDARLAPLDAAAAIASRYESAVTLAPRLADRLLEELAPKNIVGGAVYDALVGLAARDAGILLLTRDGRARVTYQALGVDFELLADGTATGPASQN